MTAGTPGWLAHEYRARRAAVLALLGKLRGDEAQFGDGVRAALTECYQRDETPTSILLPRVLELVTTHVRGDARRRLLEALEAELAHLDAAQHAAGPDDGGPSVN